MSAQEKPSRKAAFEIIRAALGDPRWRRVLTWPELPASAKLAWFTMYIDLAEGRVPAIVTTSATGVSYDTGTTDSASGRRAMDSLIKFGLAQIRRQHKGKWEVELFDPLDKAKALRISGSDRLGEQQLLFADYLAPEGEGQDGCPAAETMKFPSSEQPPAADPPAQPPQRADPPRSTTSETSGVRESNQDLDLKTSGTFRSGKDQAGGGSADGPAANIFGRAVEDALNRTPDLVARQAAVERIVEQILGRVDDPLLQVTPCLRVAWAIMDGELPPHELHRLLKYIDRHRSSIEYPWRCFVGSMMKRFRELEILWIQKRGDVR